MRSLRELVERVVAMRYVPVVTLLVVALASLGVVRWIHVDWRERLSQTLAALDNVYQARLNLTRGYLAATRARADDPTFGLDRSIAYLEEATAALDNWLAGRTGLVGFRAASPDDAGLRALAREYRTVIEDFRADLERAGGADVAVDQRVAFAALERSADAIEARIHDGVYRLILRQERRHALLIGGWVAFLAVIGVMVSAVAGAHERSEARYRLLSRMAPVGILRCDGESRCAEFNEAWVEVTGRTDWPGRSWLDAAHAEDRAAVTAAWERLVATGEPLEAECRFERPDRTVRWVLGRVHAEPRERARPRFVGSFTDVTDRKAVEAQLRHAQKMEAVGQMTGSIAHDFRNILTIIMATAESLEHTMRDAAPEIRDDITHLKTAAARGADITRKLLAFSRMEQLAVRPVDVGVVLRENLPMLRRLVPPEVELTLDVPDHGIAVLADVNAVTHILANLVANARDAMPRGGTVRIAAHPHREDRASPPASAPGEFVMISVSDTGTGMDAHTRARLFDLFFTTKPPGAGTGLGMSAVQRLMRDQDGVVEVESAPGEGTRVLLFFRASDQRPRVSGPIARSTLARGTGTILLVEDDASLRRVTQRSLERLGYEVVAAADGQTALEVLRQDPSRFALVLCDAVMPRLTGMDLHAAVRREGWPVRFLFTSGHSREEATEQQLARADEPYLPKPWTLRALAEKVREALGQGDA